MLPSISASFVPLEPIFELNSTSEEQQQTGMLQCEIDLASSMPDPSQMPLLLRALEAHLQHVNTAPGVQTIGVCARYLSHGVQLAGLWTQRVAIKVQEWSKEFALAANGLSAQKEYNYQLMPTEFERLLGSIRHDASLLVLAIDQLHLAAGVLLQITGSDKLSETGRQQLISPANEIKESQRSIESLLKALLQQCFLVYYQPPQVMKREKNFGISFRLLVAEALMKCRSLIRVLKVDEKLRVRIVTEREKTWLFDPKNAGQELPEPKLNDKELAKQPHFKMGERLRRKHDGDAGDGGSRSRRRRRTRSPSVNDEPQANGGGWDIEGSYAVSNRCSLDTLVNGVWMLELQHTRTGTPGGDSTKYDPPFYYLVGECRVAIVGEETEWVVLRAFSLPMLLPVGNEQLERYELSVFWRNAFAKLETVPWDSLCSELTRLFKAQTGNAPNKDSFDYLKSKAFSRTSNQYLISRSDLEKRALSLLGESFSLWRWLHKVKRLLCIKDSTLAELWRGGHIWGFVSKKRAAEILQQYSIEHPNIIGFILIRFSESTLDAISVSGIITGGAARHVKPWPRDELKKSEGELQRRLADDFRQPENYALIPSGCLLSNILKKDGTNNVDVLSGYEEHFNETPARSPSVGNNFAPDPNLVFNPVNPFGGTSVATTRWNNPGDGTLRGVAPGQLGQFSPLTMGMTSQTSAVNHSFGGQSLLNAFCCASSPMTMTMPLLSGPNTSQFGQANGMSFNQMPPLQSTFSDGVGVQLPIASSGPMFDFASNRDNGAPSPQVTGPAASAHLTQGNSLLPIQTLLKPIKDLTLQQSLLDNGSFPSEQPFNSAMPVLATTHNSSFVPNISTHASGFHTRDLSQQWQLNFGVAASNTSTNLNMANHLNSPNTFYPYQPQTPILPQTPMCLAPPITSSPVH